MVLGEGEGLDSEEGVGGGLPQSAQETTLPALLPHQRSALTSGGSRDIRGWSGGQSQHLGSQSQANILHILVAYLKGRGHEIEFNFFD
jgi:hypothetical protein